MEIRFTGKIGHNHPCYQQLR